MNPARKVKSERFSRTEGKTLAFVEGEVQTLLDAVETSARTGLRDRALLATFAYTFARIGSVVNLKVEDYYPSAKRFFLRFKEKGGKENTTNSRRSLTSTLKRRGLAASPVPPLSRPQCGRPARLSRRPLVRTDAADMLKRRLKQAGLLAHYSEFSRVRAG